MYSGNKAMRDAFGDALADIGAQDDRIVVLTADLTDAIKVGKFKEQFPERFYQMGIKESDMIGTAAGMAIDGQIPFTSTFAVFTTSLANQAIRVNVAYNNANVKIATSHGGVCVGADGATHQAFEDVALMRLIPNMTILVPCDANEAYKATIAAAKMDGPVYLRFGRIPSPVVTGADDPFEIGKARILRDGKDVAIVAMGAMVPAALEAASILAADGIQAKIVDMHTIKPLDENTIIESAKDCGCVVTAEEHTVLGGLGGAVAEVLAKNLPTPLRMVGVLDTFGESGEPQEILEKYHLTYSDIVEQVRLVLKQK
ncbi:MAG: transketolase family protein [Sphaerochaetaceae bacterium]